MAVVAMIPQCFEVGAGGPGMLSSVVGGEDEAQDVNGRGKGGTTGLMYAACQGEVHCMELLLEYKADVNLKDDNGNTALTLASALVEFDNSNGPLAWAKDGTVDEAGKEVYELKKGEISEVIKLLLEANADVNLQNNDGETALMCAITNENIETVKLLLSKKPDLGLKNKYGKTALQEAAKDGREEIYDILKSHT